MDLYYDFKPGIVTRLGYVKHKGKGRGFQGTAHAHDQGTCEIIYADYGTINLTVGERAVTLRHGECVIIGKGVTHSFKSDEAAPFDFMNILFRGAPPESILNKSLTAGRECAALFDKLKDESVSEMPMGPEIMACYLTELIIKLARQSTGATPVNPAGPAYRENWNSATVSKAMSVIAGNYRTELTLAKLSKSVSVSASHLCALLRRETGENFSSILHKHRVSAAKHLLREGVMSIPEIAAAVGYSSVSFFFKIFKRVTGMTPKAYALSLGDPSERE
jgi:AraC-like DNA-binding protein